MTRSMIQTSNGYVVYGAFTCVMHLDKKGTVTYSNMTPDSQEFQAMYQFFKDSK